MVFMLAAVFSLRLHSDLGLHLGMLHPPQVATLNHKADHTCVSAEHPPDCILSFGNPRQRSPAEQGGPDPPPHERFHCEADC